MVDFTRIQAQVKKVAPLPAAGGGGQGQAATDYPLGASPPLTTDRVDKLCHQLEGINAIAVAPLTECAHFAGLTQLPAWFKLAPVG
jgi:hypothetical protein